MHGATAITSCAMFYDHFNFQSSMGESAQFLRRGLCWQNLKPSAKASPLDKGRKKMNMNETIFNTCKECVESTCWFLLQDNVKAGTLIPQKKLCCKLQVCCFPTLIQVL